MIICAWCGIKLRGWRRIVALYRLRYCERCEPVFYAIRRYGTDTTEMPYPYMERISIRAAVRNIDWSKERPQK
jgi:hypothetical protein